MVTLLSRLALALLLAVICRITGALAQDPVLDCSQQPGLLHPIFSTNIVLQRNAAVPVWGCTEPGSKVTVMIAGQTVKTAADADGFWKLHLAPMPAGGPYSMVVTAATKRTISNVFFGDVWLCSGQSNMEMALWKVLNADEEMADSVNYPQIRLFKVPPFTGLPTPSQTFYTSTSWLISKPTTTRGFSAACYFFARDLFNSTGVAQGLIQATYGGTRIEDWMSASSLANDPDFAATIADITAGVYPQDTFYPTSLFNGMISPVLPFALRGIVWYQGESNAALPIQYRRLLPNMIADWRSRFGIDAGPFLIVQLPRYSTPQTQPSQDYGWVGVREAQLQTAKTLPGVGLAVTVDTGQSDTVHPPDKQDVGDRIAVLARGVAYNEAITAEGPLYAGMATEGSTIRISFLHAENGLMVGHKEPLQPVVAVPNGSLTGFAVAGADRKFVWGNAIIDGSTVVVSAPGLAAPVAVRYDWATNPAGNLYGVEGLPVSPFRTDAW